MRTTLALDDDVASFLEAERRRTGETLRQVANRLMRRGFQREPASGREVSLPVIDGGVLVDIADTSATLADLEDVRLRESGLL